MLRVEKLDTLTPDIINFLGYTLDGYDNFYIQEISHGVSELWEINGGESFCITRLESDLQTNKTILVVCVYRGKNIEQFCDHVLKIVEGEKWGLRFHTFKPAFAKWMTKKYKFENTEYVITRD